MNRRKELYLCTVLYIICSIDLQVAIFNNSFDGMVYASAFYGYTLMGVFMLFLARDTKSFEVPTALQMATVICLVVATCKGDFQGEIFRYGYTGGYIVMIDLIIMSVRELKKKI